MSLESKSKDCFSLWWKKTLWFVVPVQIKSLWTYAPFLSGDVNNLNCSRRKSVRMGTRGGPGWHRQNFPLPMGYNFSFTPDHVPIFPEYLTCRNGTLQIFVLSYPFPSETRQRGVAVTSKRGRPKKEKWPLRCSRDSGWRGGLMENVTPIILRFSNNYLQTYVLLEKYQSRWLYIKFITKLLWASLEFSWR